MIIFWKKINLLKNDRQQLAEQKTAFRITGSDEVDQSPRKRKENEDLLTEPAGCGRHLTMGSYLLFLPSTIALFFLLSLLFYFHLFSLSLFLYLLSEKMSIRRRPTKVESYRWASRINDTRAARARSLFYFKNSIGKKKKQKVISSLKREIVHACFRVLNIFQSETVSTSTSSTASKPNTQTHNIHHDTLR